MSKMFLRAINDAEESKVAEKWLHWCRSHKNVKCIEYEVPEGILPKHYRGTLVDVKVFARKWTPDDKIYSSNEDLRQKVARGNCVLELIHLNNGIRTTSYHFLIFALKKFSGGMGDEDEDSVACQNLWQNYFIRPLESAATVVVTGKANGEAAHLSCRQIAGESFFCIGSKNVHLLAKNLHDLAKYSGSRFDVALVVANTFFKSYMENPKITANQQAQFIAYLQSTKYTTVMEVLQPANQHIEDLSYLDGPELRFICWTDLFSEKDCDSLCSLPTNTAIEKAMDFGLSAISCGVIQASEANDYMLRIRGEINYEGKVLYFLDPEENVFGILKKKTAWYIILRALREKACSFSSPKTSHSHSEMEKKITKRIVEIQVWLGFSDEYRRVWTELGTSFVTWLVNIAKKQPARGIAIRAQFPQLWKEFLETHPDKNELYSTLTYH